MRLSFVAKQFLFVIAVPAVIGIASLFDDLSNPGWLTVVFILTGWAAAIGSSLRLKCPRCRSQVMVNRHGWHPRLQCPNCGHWFDD